MYWGLYQTLLLLAGAGTGAVLVARKSVIPLGFVSAGLWSILSLQARSIEIYDASGNVTVVESEAWQFVALGLALLMLGTTILYWWGVFPPEENAQDTNPVDYSEVQ